MPKIPFYDRGVRILELLRLRKPRPPSGFDPVTGSKCNTRPAPGPASGDCPTRDPGPSGPAHTPSVQGQPQNRLDDRAKVTLTAYLDARENLPEDIAKLHRILAMPHVILEIGCGTCEVAHEVALKNPGWGVIASDKYDWDPLPGGCSHYQATAQKFRAKLLKVQQAVPANLVVLRAEADILRFIPDQSIDSALLVNPEPFVGQTFIDLISEHPLYAKIKPGRRQIVVVPFSRDLGEVTCGGFEFNHSDDWSRGLGFLMGSRFNFQMTDGVQWGVDLRRSSPYSGNSTQTNVYLCGSGR